jgi:hypothetical protein
MYEQKMNYTCANFHNMTNKRTNNHTDNTVEINFFFFNSRSISVENFSTTHFTKDINIYSIMFRSIINHLNYLLYMFIFFVFRKYIIVKKQLRQILNSIVTDIFPSLVVARISLKKLPSILVIEFYVIPLYEN